MLEGITVVGDIIIIVVGIGEERVACGKHITRGEVRSRQQSLAWFFDGEQALVVITQILAEFIAQVGIRVSVANDLDGLCTADAAVVGCHNHLIVFLCNLPEEIGYDRMAER